jgi:hypothetical protein
MVANQAFWVAAALLALVVFMTWLEPTFGTADNVTNVTRNFAPLAIMSLGMTVVIITGGIDLSVGSVMGLVAIVTGLLLTWHYSWYVAFLIGLLVLLRHKFRRLLCLEIALMQQGHRDSVDARAALNFRRTVEIEFGTWRSGRNGGTPRAISFGNCNLFEKPGGTCC